MVQNVTSVVFIFLHGPQPVVHCGCLSSQQIRLWLYMASRLGCLWASLKS